MTEADLERVRTARSNYCQQLAELSNPAKKKISYSMGGRSVSWTEYQKSLLELIKGCDEQLAAYGVNQPDGGYILTAME